MSGPPGGAFGESSYRLSGGGYDSYVDRLGYAAGGSAALLSDAAPVTYATMSGTSMAAPHVSGVAALLASRAPSAGYREIKAAILDSAEKTPGLEGRMATGGRLDANAALAQITAPAPTPEATRLAVSPSRKIVPYNGKVLLTGGLTDASGGKLESRPVAVWRSGDGGESWSRNGAAEYHPASGSYRAVRSLTSNATFQLRFAGSGTHASSVSRPALVRSRAYLSRPQSPLLVKRGEYFVTRGILKPLHADKTRLVFERYSPASGWKVYKRVNAPNMPRPGYATYSLRHKLPSAGVWRVRAYHADRDHAPTWSPAKRFMVRR